jgi:general secretion pathway protein A
VHAASDGVPRLINVICDRALTAAYAEQRDRVDTRLVKRAAREVAGRHASGPLRWALAAGVLPLALVVGFGLSWKIQDLPLERPGQATAYLIGHSQDAPAQARQPTLTEDPKVSTDPPRTTAQTRAPDPVNDPPRVEKRAAALIEPASEPPAPSLQDLLEARALATDSVTAFKTLFAYWDQDYSRLSGNGACERALRVGLECLFAQGNLNTLRTYDRPAVLELIDDTGTRHHVTLTGLTRDEAVLDFGGKIVTVPTGEVEASWYGSYVLLWRPPQLSQSVLRVGSRGNDVLWLRERLARVGAVPLSSDPSPVFDADLAESVKRFQQASGLPADGIVGRQTLLRLNSEMSDTPVPLLSARVDLETEL